MKTLSPILEVDNLSKTYRDFWRRPTVEAVKNISFRLDRGEIFGLLGPNGSGKSTSIKMILGLLRPTNGSIALLKGDPQSVANKSRIGYLPEISHLHRFLTPRETLRYYADLFGLGAEAGNQRIDELLRMVSLEDAADRPIGEFSKGMARRVSLAQALINNPELLILDEPTSGLDPIACREVKDWLLMLAEQGKTILMTSHLLADVEDICDRIAIMRRGEIAAMGAVETLLQRDGATRFTIEGLSQPEAASLKETLQRESELPVYQDTPKLDLETFFLQAVSQGETHSSTETDHRKPAPFLIGDYEPERIN